MTTHLELARIQLNSSGIPQGSTQGVGTIIELETPYNGNANPVDVHLIYPASSAIPGQTVVSCYFQSNEGWYIVQGEPGPAGQGGSPWVRFRVLNPIGYQSSGIWNCRVTQTLAVGVDVGDDITIHDPNNLFADVVFESKQTATACDAATYIGGSTGTAYLRTPQSSDNNPEGVTRWEVETCTRSIDRMNVRLDDCMRAYEGSDEWTGIGFIKINDAWNLSAYPAVDFPPEVVDDPASESPYCWAVTITNPLALTAKADSIVSIRRHTRKKPSLPLNVVTPHDVGVEQDSELWWVEQVYERRVNPNAGGSYARFIIVTKGGDWGGYSLVRYWMGQDPSADLPCRPGIDCTFPCDCLLDGDQLFGIFNEFTHKYELVSTASAMLGTPDDVDVFTDASSAACGFNFLKQPTKAFTCGENPYTVTKQIATTTVGVYASGYRNENDLCLQKIDIEVCSWDAGAVDCYNLCAECDCDDHVCAYQYTQGEGWELVKACPTDFEDCCCTGEMPTNTPSGTDPTYVTFPCGPCPSECLECDLCDIECPTGITIVINDIVGDLNNGDRVELQIDTQVWTPHEDDCCFNLEAEFKEFNSGQTATATAKVCLIDPSNIPACAMNGNFALQFEWTPAAVLGMTLPTELGASQAGVCVAEYGNNLGCGILPDFPDVGGNWDNVTANVSCCEVVEGRSRDFALESMGVHDVGAGFHNASLQAPPPADPKEVAKPQGWGDAFVQKYPRLFKGCGCKKDIVPVMNRWERREGEPSDDSVLLVATTLYGKQKRGIQSQISVESLSNDIREFTNRMRNNG